jgi:hypothetical protein
MLNPTDNPNRFTPDEAALFHAGLCSWVTEYGTQAGTAHCCQPMMADGLYGYCAEHEDTA